MLKTIKHIFSWQNSLGFLLVTGSTLLPALRNHGFAAPGVIIAIGLIVFSLFGELPSRMRWIQRLGEASYRGVLAGAFVVLLFYLIPSGSRESSIFAFSPSVWAAYISIVLVTLSFRYSSLPRRIYALCQRTQMPPYILIPIFVAFAGLLGNVLDGVSIISISVIIFLGLLERAWAIRASFALLFGGLISNLITVAAEPTNIKFDEVLHGVLTHIHPYFWFSNWPISIFGILVPALALGYVMFTARVPWSADEPAPGKLDAEEAAADDPQEVMLSVLAVGLLGCGVVSHSVFTAIGLLGYDWPLWQLLLPAGLVAVLDILYLRKNGPTLEHLETEAPIWFRLMAIFSLLWLLINVLSQYPSVTAVFFLLPFAVQYGLMIILSLLSAVTDNVALASMQGSLILQHPLDVWQIRLLFILLTWAGGLTAFGCLQSLALNSHLKLTGRQWLRETPLWAATSIMGGLFGLLLVRLLYPTAF